MAVKRTKSALKVCTHINVCIIIPDICNDYIMQFQVLIKAMRKNEGGMVLFDLGWSGMASLRGIN